MKSILLWSLLFCCAFAHSQTLTGKVVTQNNTPLQDVAVYNHTTTHHSHTNAVGIFSLDNVSVNDQIFISYLGYEAFIYSVKNEDFAEQITIRLNESAI